MFCTEVSRPSVVVYLEEDTATLLVGHKVHPRNTLSDRYIAELLMFVDRPLRAERFVVLRNAMPRDWVERCAEAFAPRFAKHIDRVSASAPSRDEGGWNRGPHRMYVDMPQGLPFAKLLEHALIGGILRRILGEEVAVDRCASDTPMGRGSMYQPIHVVRWRYFSPFDCAVRVLSLKRHRPGHGTGEGGAAARRGGAADRVRVQGRGDELAAGRHRRGQRCAPPARTTPPDD